MDAFGICINAALERLFLEAMRTIGKQNEKAIVNEMAKIMLRYNRNTLEEVFLDVARGRVQDTAS